MVSFPIYLNHFTRAFCLFFCSDVEGYWIEKGSLEPQDDPSYVRAASVQKNLAQLARVVCSGKFPVLLEGETSCGKTAMVCFRYNWN